MNTTNIDKKVGRMSLLRIFLGHKLLNLILIKDEDVLYQNKMYGYPFEKMNENHCKNLM